MRGREPGEAKTGSNRERPDFDEPQRASAMIPCAASALPEFRFLSADPLFATVYLGLWATTQDRCPNSDDCRACTSRVRTWRGRWAWSLPSGVRSGIRRPGGLKPEV